MIAGSVKWIFQSQSADPPLGEVQNSLATLSWVYQLNEDEIEDIESAIRIAKRSGLSLRELTADHFQLSALAPTIRKWMRDLNHGRGFVLVRGFPAEKYSKEDAALGYWAIG